MNRATVPWLVWVGTLKGAAVGLGLMALALVGMWLAGARTTDMESVVAGALTGVAAYLTVPVNAAMLLSQDVGLGALGLWPAKVAIFAGVLTLLHRFLGLPTPMLLVGSFVMLPTAMAGAWFSLGAAAKARRRATRGVVPRGRSRT